MAEIKISITELDHAVNQLKELYIYQSGMNKNYPDTVGGGETVNEIEAMALIYKDVYKSLGELFKSTIEYLQLAKTSFEKSDNEAYKGIVNKK